MIIADLHLHSKYSRATAKNLDLEHIFIWAQKKGLHLVGTGDFTHPAWFSELETKLVPDHGGLFELREEFARPLLEQIPRACQGPVKFILQTEISSIYKFGDKVRKVHNLVMFPDLESARLFNARLAAIGNITSDGRPILGLDSRDLLEIALEACSDVIFIPAHIWTPWFSALGSKSGFDSIQECYRDLVEHIHAVETGLSSDPLMNWRVSSLDGFHLVSNSDAHSPAKLAREATLFECGLTYPALLDALRTGVGMAGTLEFFPEEGKYHLDGHRKCGVRLTPEETAKLKGLCPVCGRKVVVGVLNRVVELADRGEGERGPRARDFTSLVALDQIVAESLGVSGRTSKKVLALYGSLLESLGPELRILLDLPLETIGNRYDSRIRTGVERVRSGHVHLEGGFDGEFGVVRVFSPREATRMQRGKALFLAPRTVPSVPRTEVSGPAPEQPSVPRTEVSGPAPEQRFHPVEEAAPALNREQEAAVKAPSGPAVVIAGPGTGKTRVLTHRIAHLLESGERAQSIVALTFTRKAAGEMRERVEAMLGPDTDSSGMFIGTFHSFCLELLRQRRARDEGGGVGLSVCTPADRELVAEEIAGAHPRAGGAKAVLAVLNQELDAPAEEGAGAPGTVAGEYRSLLARWGLVDLHDVVRLGLELLEDPDRDFAAEVFARIEHLLVDEFQDIDEEQYRLVRLIGSSVSDVMVIGDPNQSIYGFRGATPVFFDEFEREFDAGRIVLQANYRSTPEIQAVSGMLLGLQKWDFLLGERATDIVLSSAPTDKAEAESVAHTIEQLLGGTASFSFNSARVDSDADGEVSFGDIAVLSRTAFVADRLEEALVRLGLPVSRPGASSKAFEELRGVLEAAIRYGRSQADRLAGRRLERFVTKMRKGGRNVSLSRVTGKLRRWRGTDAGDLAKLLFDLLYPGNATAEEREAFERLLAGISGRTASPEDLAFTLATLKEEEMARAGSERVSVLTLHASKGLEFDVVFVCGLEEGLLPYSVSGRESDLEEERRLLYVGMTRAKKKLYLTHARRRMVFGKKRETSPSRFLAEIEERLARSRRSGPKKKRKPKRPQKTLL